MPKGPDSRFPYAVKVKRVYNSPDPADGFRILVDRMWPRGLTKGQVQVHTWPKDIAPSSELRKWFGHDPSRWPEFRSRYQKELGGKTDLVRTILSRLSDQPVTLVYAASDADHNNALCLRDYLVNHPTLNG